MRVLVIAYEFPPSPSPQSLRWRYLAAELAAQGVDVHVLTVDELPSTMLRVCAPDGVTVHRSFPGCVIGGVTWLGRRKRAIRGEGGPACAVGAEVAVRTLPSRLNWKGRLIEAIQRLAAKWYFPDIRGEWQPFARRRLRQLLCELRPDVVVSSHEPATTLQLGVLAKSMGFPWLADLGDPVLCSYTPARWRNKALRLERRTCREADQVTVTSAGARELLIERHGVAHDRVKILTQGFDASWQHSPSAIEFDPERLELLFTGSFYSFRNPQALLEAVVRYPSVRLNIATSRWPEALESWLVEYPQQLRLLGFLPHAEAIAVQRAADVLVNIANDDPVHVPGKIFEYLGARRPILQLGNDANDAAAVLLAERGCGVRCEQRSESIELVLSDLVRMKHEGTLDAAFNLNQDGLERYSWQGLSRQLLHSLKAIAPGAAE
ncbi:glycosyltransferase [Lysobacter niabensis]|uniref:glycosyltransferase n=1 Tax=Agrilutibacter niabensis TaxID=380628 RepID=UPI0036224763